MYCSVVSACFDMLDIRRAQEWTAALDEWCATQPGLVPYRGECLAHRAEILRLHGHWSESFDEARRACDALMAAHSPRYAVAAYTVAELHRLRGESTAAEEAYREAAEHGRAPHPGLALLRLAQGEAAAARAAIERMMAEPTTGRQRADVLAGAVDVFLASGDLAAAERAAEALTAMIGSHEAVWMRALAATAEGAVHLAAGRAGEALVPLRNALIIWDDLHVAYEAARVRVLLGRACRALGDADGARMEWDAAARVFLECGAAPALAEVERLRREPPARAQAPGGHLTSRELEVLRLVARGRTNRAIARELEISEKTVARHVSNIFTKLSLSTRAAATAYAFTHRLMS